MSDLGERRRGGLRIFLGAAPGVGKTYAMLREGNRQLAEGRDVVIGLLETHGRSETALQQGALEMVARLEVPYKGATLHELDVDAVLHRHPDVALIDELAHSNPPGSARTFRWQDINVIRDAGIDVLTTMNIQHVQEFADVVSSITGIEVAQTVPDRVLDDATEIQLIDLPIDELVRRLENGKIYPPNQASVAGHHFFTVTKLSALRELALRRSAADADDRLALFMQEDIGATVEASERVAVLLEPVPEWGDIVRQAWRLARAFRSELHVLVMPDIRIAGRTQLELAQDLGGRIVPVQMEDPDDPIGGLVDALRQNRITVLLLPTEVYRGRFGREKMRNVHTMRRVLRDLPHVAVQMVSMKSMREHGNNEKLALHSINQQKR